MPRLALGIADSASDHTPGFRDPERLAELERCTVLDASRMLPLTREDFDQAFARVAGFVDETPLKSFSRSDKGQHVLLKLESEQQGGSYKVRGAFNAALSIPDYVRARGLTTVSSGNMGRAVAWSAMTLGVPATVGVPSTAPEIKVQAIRDLGAKIVLLSADDWWRSILTSNLAGHEGTFISPVLNREVLAGAGTVAWEILRHDPEVTSIYVPFGGGALALGSAYAASHVRPGVRIVACEPSAKAPLAKSFHVGHEQSVVPGPSIVDAAGGPSLLPGLWPLFETLVSAAVAVSDTQTRSAIRALAERHITRAEGAGALALAAAISQGGLETIACVVSGRNIDPGLFSEIVGKELAASVR